MLNQKMIIHSQTIKETGATFTPPDLSNFLAKKLFLYSNKHDQLILDPACGDGALLLAIGQVFKENFRNFELIGYDSNNEYLKFAKEKLAKNSFTKNVNLFQKNFLETVNIVPGQRSLFERDENAINEYSDIIIANPPYVRTQILGAEQSQKFAKKYNLKGRVDLYYPFLIAMTHALKENGLIGVITSNRYLSTRSGSCIRKFLNANYEILEIIDLGDTKLFNAAVLPAIFIGKKKCNYKNTSAKFFKIYENLDYSQKITDKLNSIYDVLDTNLDGNFGVGNKHYIKSSGITIFKSKNSDLWTMLSKNEARFVTEIQNNIEYKISDYFKVKVGVKTTADKVFIRDNWDSLGDEKPEDILLKDLISQENIEEWGINNNKKLKILYPYFANNNKKELVNISNYPKAFRYLKSHEELLKRREYLIKAGRKWYEIWVPQNPVLWSLPKVIFPDISPTPRFYYDNSGRIVNGNCYWIVAQKNTDVDLLLLIQGIGNSKLITKYHDLVFNNKLYSGRRRYFSQYVENYPVPNVNSKYSQKIIEIVKVLNSGSYNSKFSLLRELEGNVAKSFNVNPVNILD